jgi:hypothetical protein
VARRPGDGRTRRNHRIEPRRRQRQLIFDPVHLTKGIELSDDALPAARSAIYSVSHQRRNP